MLRLVADLPPPLELALGNRVLPLEPIPLPFRPGDLALIEPELRCALAFEVRSFD
jgi:hypothetical protein